MYEFLVRTAVTTNKEAVWSIDLWTCHPVVQGSLRHLLVFFFGKRTFLGGPEFKSSATLVNRQQVASC